MSRRLQLADLRRASPVVLPSLLLCDFGSLEREIGKLTAAGVRALHLDVMDGHFVPNFTYGLPIVEAVRRLTDMPLDVHLMISEPGIWIDRFLEAGADSLTIHAEAVTNPVPVLEQIRSQGALAGLAINPPTQVDRILPALEACDLVLVMSVMPGFGGQSFDQVALDKLRTLSTLVAPHVLLEVDGGVNASTVGACAEAGAHLLVVGSAIFRTLDYSASVSSLSRLARSPVGVLKESPCSK